MRARLLCGVAALVACLAIGGGVALSVSAATHTGPDVGTPPRLVVGTVSSFVVPSLSRGEPSCPSSDGSSITCYSPAFIQQAYDYPTNRNAPTGAGQTILVVEPYGSPTISADLQAFDSAFGIAPATLTIVGPNGTGDPTDPDVIGWGVETSLDVEWAHAIAPGAKIVLAVAPTDDPGDIVATETSVLPQYPGAIVSQSFGVDENDPDPDSQAFISGLHALYQTLPSSDTLIASAGDEGATDATDSIVAAYPASDPLVLGVGGTQGKPYPGGLWRRGGYGNEATWNESRQGTYYAAGGGAPSILFTAPSWQRGSNRNAPRTVPDVSYNAAIDGGVIVFDGPNVFTVGGTSAGPPQWAGIVALADELRARGGAAPLGLGAAAALYAIASSDRQYSNDFHDITDGNNILVDQSLGFRANRGYDLATGLGTPDIANLISDLARGSWQRPGRDDDDFSGNHPGSFGNPRARGAHIHPAG